MSGWIKIASYPPTYNSIILSNRNPDLALKPGSFIGVGGLQSSLSKRLEYVQNTVPSDDEYTFDYMSSNTQLELDTWYFFAITYECEGNLSNRVRIYINGSLESQKLMDEIRIYGRALSEEKILALYKD